MNVGPTAPAAALPANTVNAEHDAPMRRQAEYQALRDLADEVLRLNREVHRGRSYASARYAA
jgi:hypothetical protein